MNDNDKSRYFGAPSAPHTFNCFTQEQVKEINKEINKNILKKEDKLLSAYDGVVDGVDTTKLGEFFHIPCLPLMKLIHPWLYQCQTLNTAIFGYDINWQFHVEGMNYNIYGKNGKYGWHIDASTNLLSDMKLTCLLNLSEEPYEGGEFCMINIKEKIKFTSGMGLVLNSLVAHKVTPVIRGERITLTYWGMGPSWR